MDSINVFRSTLYGFNITTSFSALTHPKKKLPPLDKLKKLLNELKTFIKQFQMNKNQSDLTLATNVQNVSELVHIGVSMLKASMINVDINAVFALISFMWKENSENILLNDTILLTSAEATQF